MDTVEERPRDAEFNEYRGSADGRFHAAEDYWRPAGTAVHAMADGEVSFSGRMGGYGWLVIVNHPDVNLYSLYGHLSPSRWTPDPGPVTKGDLIGYLGDEWENGGSQDEPLVAHLHLGVRTGQRTDYPGKGEWRWMAGWIELCPSSAGWLQPSTVIAAQTIPEGGWEGPAGGIVEKWWTEGLVVLLMLLGPLFWIAQSIRKQNAVAPFALTVVLVILVRYLSSRGFVLVGAVYVVAGASFVTGIGLAIRRATNGAGGTSASG
jgi:murein DD-endopeptidase MepM/ murein hydrolase activator NlpD